MLRHGVVARSSCGDGEEVSALMTFERVDDPPLFTATHVAPARDTCDRTNVESIRC